MLANTADTGRVEYNTVDATLWFLHAVDRHVAVTGDTTSAPSCCPALRGVVAAHLAGTRYGIGVDPADGLLTQGAPGEALTWMDARVDGVPVTPRAGKPVEVNALWINGLAGGRAGRAGPGRARTPAARSTRASGRPRSGVWLTTCRARADVPRWAAAPRRRPLRPNQLLAWSLPYAPLRAGPAAAGGRSASALLTPLGLRSLAPDDPAYLGRHRGGPAERDPAYHQGTVWPWLIGPYVHGQRPTADGCWPAWRRIWASTASARSARPPTATPRTAPPAARSRRGRWPSCFESVRICK